MIQINKLQCVEKKGRWYYFYSYDEDHVLISKTTISKSEYDRAIRLKRFISDDSMTVGDRIIEILNNRGIQQLELSKATGISQSCIADWKTKSTSPAANKIIPICDFLGITPEELLRGAK